MSQNLQTITFNGVGEVRAALKELSADHNRSTIAGLARGALRAGLGVLVKEIKRSAPTHSIVRRTGKRKKKFARLRNIRKAVGSRIGRNRRKGIYEAKAGLNVGKAAGRFPAAAAYTLGTKRRKTRKGLNRGVMPGNSFVRDAATHAEPVVEQYMVYTIRRRLPIEVERVRRRHEKRAASAAVTK